MPRILLPTLSRRLSASKKPQGYSLMELLEYNIGNGARAFSTMRGGGSGNYGGFNITHYCGDEPSHVAACRKELCCVLGITDANLVLPRQTHSDKVACIDAALMQLPPQEREVALHGVDAVVTALPGVCIGVSTADCIPILLYDAQRGVTAAIHAGWRGTVSRIVTGCIEKMNAEYGCCPADITAVIAPGISIEAFEVGDEVYREFMDAGFAMEGIAARYPAADGGKKWHIDLWEANRQLLLEAGVPDGNISVAGVCTYTSYDKFFSARRLGIQSGRIFNGIIIER